MDRGNPLLRRFPPATTAGPPIRSLNRRPSPPAPRTRAQARYSEVYAPPKAGADASSLAPNVWRSINRALALRRRGGPRARPRVARACRTSSTRAPAAMAQRAVRPRLKTSDAASPINAPAPELSTTRSSPSAMPTRRAGAK